MERPETYLANALGPAAIMSVTYCEGIFTIEVDDDKGFEKSATKTIRTPE